MGNCKLEHHQSCINAIPPIGLEMAIVKTQKQHVGVDIIQSLNAGITTTGVETIVVTNIDVIKKGVLIGSTTKLGNELGGVRQEGI
jgi:hypothetical protein